MKDCSQDYPLSVWLREWKATETSPITANAQPEGDGIAGADLVQQVAEQAHARCAKKPRNIDLLRDGNLRCPQRRLPPMIGQTLGHYRIIEKIGAGGMGVVYRASDERLDRDVALKVLPVEMMADLNAVKLFRQEAQALSKLNHPNIATVHDFDTHDGLSFLAMEYIPGTTLDHKIAAGPLPEKEVVRLGVQLAQGLQAAHCKGVVHRDLKPSNLRTTPDCRLK